jgi:hypothetical protein
MSDHVAKLCSAGSHYFVPVPVPVLSGLLPPPRRVSRRSSKPFTVIPMVVTNVQDYIPAGQVRHHRRKRHWHLAGHWASRRRRPCARARPDSPTASAGAADRGVIDKVGVIGVLGRCLRSPIVVERCTKWVNVTAGNVGPCLRQTR